MGVARSRSLVSAEENQQAGCSIGEQDTAAGIGGYRPGSQGELIAGVGLDPEGSDADSRAEPIALSSVIVDGNAVSCYAAAGEYDSTVAIVPHQSKCHEMTPA